MGNSGTEDKMYSQDPVNSIQCCHCPAKSQGKEFDLENLKAFSKSYDATGLTSPAAFLQDPGIVNLPTSSVCH